MKRVVVTGIGVVCPIGNSLHESWLSAKKGLSGIAPIKSIDTSSIKWVVSGELKEFRADRYLSKKELIRLDPFIHYAVAAAVMAVEDAGLMRQSSDIRQELTVKKRPVDFSINESKLIPNNYLSSGGVIIGSSRGGIITIERELRKLYFSNSLTKRPRLSAYLMPSTTIGMAPSYVAQKLGIKGYCLGISNACASGTNAIGEGYRLIKSGFKYPLLCGGAEAPLCLICIEGYGRAGALSKVQDHTASRPFDKSRDGFVLSEGACILVLEEYEMALNRGARIYGEIVGYGNTTDSFHQTNPSVEGQARTMRNALIEGGLKPEDVDFISAHATSTPVGDKIETEAIKLCFGKFAYSIPISSIKSMTGHMLAASGPLEVAFTLLGMSEGIILPTINLRERDPLCDLDYVTELRKKDIEIAICNSFGFGGLNAVLVLKKVTL